MSRRGGARGGRYGVPGFEGALPTIPEAPSGFSGSSSGGFSADVSASAAPLSGAGVDAPPALDLGAPAVTAAGRDLLKDSPFFPPTFVPSLNIGVPNWAAMLPPRMGPGTRGGDLSLFTKEPPPPPPQPASSYDFFKEQREAAQSQVAELNRAKLVALAKERLEERKSTSVAGGAGAASAVMLPSSLMKRRRPDDVDESAAAASASASAKRATGEDRSTEVASLKDNEPLTTEIDEVADLLKTNTPKRIRDTDRARLAAVPGGANVRLFITKGYMRLEFGQSEPDPKPNPFGTDQLADALNMYLQSSFNHPISGIPYMMTQDKFGLCYQAQRGSCFIDFWFPVEHPGKDGLSLGEARSLTEICTKALGLNTAIEFTDLSATAAIKLKELNPKRLDVLIETTKVSMEKMWDTVEVFVRTSAELVAGHKRCFSASLARTTVEPGLASTSRSAMFASGGAGAVRPNDSSTGLSVAMVGLGGPGGLGGT